MDDLITYMRHTPVAGIDVEELGGGAPYSDRLWLMMARQVWSEHDYNGVERWLDHLPSGAPYLDDADLRISISHTRGLMVVATMPGFGSDLTRFDPKCALGIDVERIDRAKVLEVRNRFLNEQELSAVDATDVEANVVAWTCKEALYKAALSRGLDWRTDYTIERLPTPGHPGIGRVNFNSDNHIELALHTYRRGAYTVTIACPKE